MPPMKQWWIVKHGGGVSSIFYSRPSISCPPVQVSLWQIPVIQHPLSVLPQGITFILEIMSLGCLTLIIRMIG